MSVGSLKQVELVKSITDLNEVPYLNFGQEIQSKRNLVRYYQVIKQLIKEKDTLATGVGMPLPHSSYVNILVDDPEMDYYRPKFITYPKSGAKVNRFGNDLDQVGLDIENEFVGIIKRIRAELGIEGSNSAISSKNLGIGVDGETIELDPREPAKFIVSLIPVLKCEAKVDKKTIGSASINTYDIDLPYFSG